MCMALQADHDEIRIELMRGREDLIPRLSHRALNIDRNSVLFDGLLQSPKACLDLSLSERSRRRRALFTDMEHDHGSLERNGQIFRVHLRQVCAGGKVRREQDFRDDSLVHRVLPYQVDGTYPIY